MDIFAFSLSCTKEKRKNSDKMKIKQIKSQQNEKLENNQGI
jgi:hypothetical protein